MIENIIHTVSKETKPSQHGPLDKTQSKSESGLGEQFRTLFKSFNSNSENSEDLQANPESMDESSVTGKGSGSDSEGLKNTATEKLIDANDSDQNTENAPETSCLAELTIIEGSITETEKSQDKEVEDSIELAETNNSESGIEKELPKMIPDGKNVRSDNQDLSKEYEELKTVREMNQSGGAQSLVDANSTNEYPRSENSVMENNYKKSPSELKESISEAVLSGDGSNLIKTETVSTVDVNHSRTDSNVQIQNVTQSTNESAVNSSSGNDKPVLEKRIENPISKQESPAGHIEKGEPQVLKSESRELLRFFNVEEGSITSLKGGEGYGTVLQQEGSINQMNSSVEVKEPVSALDEMKQFNSNEKNSSTDLKSSEIYPQKSVDGEFNREKIQPTERVPKSVQPFAAIKSSELRLNSESAEKFVDRLINENIEKPIRIAQNPVESTVLIQDKFQPKKERNDVSFLNNNESKESSRLNIQGIGADVAKRSPSLSSGQYSEDHAGFNESEKNEIHWKEHAADLAESDELSRSELSTAALSKLGDSALSNHFLRRVLLPGLTQTVLTASGQSDRAENWQRHNFILEDGSKVQLSARKVDGVLQIKLGASIGELGKMLQVHQDEIREHLEKECNIKIDLQFEQGSGDQDQSSLDNFFSESTNKPVFDGGSETGDQPKKNIKKQLHTVITRNFGYNSKEWTA